MIIEELTIKNFRNYSNQKIDFSPGINFILGPNGAGKTNILEAISITANLRSFRNIHDSEIVQWDKEAYHCSSLIAGSEERLFEVGCGIIDNKLKKKAKIDGKEIKSIADYYGKMLITVFSPVDINLINDSPDVRRRFFDSVISKIDRAYLATLTDFKKVLASRNKLLKHMREHGSKDLTQLEVWNNLFAEKAAIITEKRAHFLKVFKPIFTNAYSTISNDGDAPDISYGNSTDAIESGIILQKLLDRQKRDIASGSTGIGPQRDDFILHNSHAVQYVNYASQGQRRTAAICLKLAECEITEKIMQQKSIILVDDILSELDKKRRNNMVAILTRGNQVLFTMVNAHSIDSYDFVDYHTLSITNGKLTFDSV